MVAALKRHLRLLRSFAQMAFNEGDSDYGGEVAGKLRLLVTRFRSNRPLLLDLMRETEIEPTVTLGGPPINRQPGEPGPGDEVTLEEYLQMVAIGIRIPSGNFVTLSKSQFIRAWAEQTGSSHEDWTMEPALAEILSLRLHLGGLPVELQELRVTTNTVLQVADRFLHEFEANDEIDDCSDA